MLVARDVLGEDLHRDGTVENLVVATVDDGTASGPREFDQSIASAEDGTDPDVEYVHR